MGTQPTDTGQSDRAFIDEALSELDAPAEINVEEETPAEDTTTEGEDESKVVEIDTGEVEEAEEAPEETEIEEETEETATLPEYKDIKAKFPTFFEDFPALKEAFFLGKQLTSLFPSYDLAVEAKDQLRSFEAIKISTLEEGDPTHLFAALSEANPAGFEKMAESILPNLFAHAPQLYLKVTTPILENLIRSAFKEGKENENKNLQAAAQIFSKYLFGTLEIPQAKPRVVDPEIKRLSNERQQGLIQKETEFKEEVQDIGITTLTRHILSGLDPNNSIPKITKQALIDEILKETGRALDKDILHNNRMNALWELSARHGFARDYRKKLVETYLRAATAKMPGIRARLRNEALGKPAQTPVAKKEVVKRPPASRAVSTDKVNISKIDPKKIDWSKTSDRDLLGGKITLKK